MSNTMKAFTLQYTLPDDPGLWLWKCQAEDFDHAVEQLENAEPTVECYELYEEKNK